MLKSMPFCPKSVSDSHGKTDSAIEDDGVSNANGESRFDKLPWYNDFIDLKRLCRNVEIN